jgi:hypothetical protein
MPEIRMKTVSKVTRSIHLTRPLPYITAAVLAITACSDAPTGPKAGDVALQSTIRFWDATASVSWNETARDLIVSRAVTNASIQARILTYLSVAQYNAVVAAEDTKNGGVHASPSAAAAAASLVVLKNFFPSPSDGGLLDAKLLAQRSAQGWPGEQNKDFSSGEAVGRAIGAQVLAYASTDNFNQATLPTNPGGPGYWTGVNAAKGLYGTRTFALTSGDQFRPGPPPGFETQEFRDALAEVRGASDGLTPSQLVIAQYWNARGPANMNDIASDMIVAHHRSEREAARVLALANMAAFDVANACWDAKFAYYLIRPSQADPMIKLPVGLSNHPAYPSAHSCFIAAYASVLGNAFPTERAVLQAMVAEAGEARIYGGLHYRFDLTAGRDLGRQVGEYVLTTAPNGHNPIPLD